MTEQFQDATITVDGQNFLESSLPVDIRSLLGVYRQWQDETQKSRLEMLKGEAALRDLSKEISEAIKAWNAGNSEKAEAPVE